MKDPIRDYNNDLSKLVNENNQVDPITKHSLNAPLDRILSFTNHLRYLFERDKLTDANFNRAMDQIDSSTKYCKEIANATSEPNFKDFNLYDLVDRIYEANAPLEGIDLEYATNPSKLLNQNIYADEKVYQIILHNAIVNSIEASKPGQAIVFSVEEQKGNYLIKITNQIEKLLSKESIDKFFEPGHSTKKNSCGEGTPTIKSTAESYGGNANIKQYSGSGINYITLEISLPIKTKEIVQEEKKSEIRDYAKRVGYPKGPLKKIFPKMSEDDLNNLTSSKLEKLFADLNKDKVANALKN